MKLAVTLADGAVEEYTVGADRNALGLRWDYDLTENTLIVDQGERRIVYPLAGVRKLEIR